MHLKFDAQQYQNEKFSKQKPLTAIIIIITQQS